MTATIPAETPQASMCPKCGKELPAGAKECASCVPKASWKDWLKPAAAVVTFVLATTTGVLGIYAVIGSSRTEILTFSSAVDHSLLAVVIKNDGRKPTRQVRPKLVDGQPQIMLTAEQTGVIAFGLLTLMSAETDSKIVGEWANFGTAIPAGGRATFYFDVGYVHPTSDAELEGFWRKHGGKPVKLSGLEVVESNGKVRDLKGSVPLSSLKDLVKLRSNLRGQVIP